MPLYKSSAVDTIYKLQPNSLIKVVFSIVLSHTYDVAWLRMGEFEPGHQSRPQIFIPLAPQISGNG
jgi:hypothetical protein